MLKRGFIPATELKPFSLCDSDLNFAVCLLMILLSRALLFSFMLVMMCEG